MSPKHDTTAQEFPQESREDVRRRRARELRHKGQQAYASGLEGGIRDYQRERDAYLQQRADAAREEQGR